MTSASGEVTSVMRRKASHVAVLAYQNRLHLFRPKYRQAWLNWTMFVYINAVVTELFYHVVTTSREQPAPNILNRAAINRIQTIHTYM